MSYVSSEICVSPQETLPEETQFALINRVANHEGKLLTTAIIAFSPDSSFRQIDLYNELVDRQGHQLKWRPGKPLGTDYCRKSLVPSGAVIEQTVSGSRGPTTAYSISEFGTKWALPLAGTLLDWSLQNPDIPLMQVFGGSASSSAVRSPEVRLRIYRELLETAVDRPSYRHIASSVTNSEIQSDEVDKQLHNMAKLGLLTINSSFEAYDPDIDIVRPDFQHLTMEFASLSPMTQAVYNTLQALTDKGETTVGLDALIDTVINSHESLNLDYYALRQNLLNGLSATGTNYPGLQMHSREIPGSQRTAVALSPNISDPIRDLVARIDAAFTGQDRAQNIQKAEAILSSNQAFAALMTKIMNLSPSVASRTDGPEVLHQRLIKAIERLGEASLKSIKCELESQGRQMSTEGIRNALEPLVETNAVVMEKRTLPKKRKLINVYSLPGPTEI